MLYTTQLNLLLNCIEGDVTRMVHVSDQHMTAWLNESCGRQGVDWKMKPKWNYFNDSHGIEVKIYDPDIAMMFRLAFIDYLHWIPE
jgi:hypothetical protein